MSMLKFEIENNNNVSLPIDKKALGDFISGLLGQPQSLERIIKTAFSVSHENLLHICSLILQRIQQQNAPEPLAFVTTITYRDGYKREISSLPAFEHFAETQNIVSTRVHINIALLIQFPSKSTPERQELVLDFDTKDKQLTYFENLIGLKSTSGEIRIEIRHTEAHLGG